MEEIVQLKNHFQMSTPDHWHHTMNLSIIQACKSFNQVPETAEALFDIQYTESDDIDRLVFQKRLCALPYA